MNARRFWDKVKKTAPDGCWEWQGFINGHGYGQFTINGVGVFKAHRLAWEIVNGTIPPSMCVLHRCDNRRCCNPAHLFVGTQLDNVADMTTKARQAKGARNARAKLSDDEVQEIRENYAGGAVSQTELSRRFGVGQSHISEIISRRKWAHLAP